MNQLKMLPEAVRHYNSLDCERDFARTRWGRRKPACPICGAKATQTAIVSENGRFRCENKACRKQFSITLGTCFENSRLPLSKWYIAAWCVTNGDTISGIELSRAIGVSPTSARFMMKRIRDAMEAATYLERSRKKPADGRTRSRQVVG